MLHLWCLVYNKKKSLKICFNIFCRIRIQVYLGRQKQGEFGLTTSLKTNINIWTSICKYKKNRNIHHTLGAPHEFPKHKIPFATNCSE